MARREKATIRGVVLTIRGAVFMHHSRLLPRAEGRCRFGLPDDADWEFCCKGNCAGAIDHERDLRRLLWDAQPPDTAGRGNARAPVRFSAVAVSRESQKLLSLRLNHCRNPQ